MQTLKERYTQKNKNKLLYETHKRRMLIIEAIEQAQLEQASALIKKLENFKKLVPDLSNAVDTHLGSLRQQKFGGEVARAVGYVASLEQGFKQLGQVLPNFFGEEEFNNPANESKTVDDLLSGDPKQKKQFEDLLKKVFSRTDGFWNKLKGFLKSPKSGASEMIDVEATKNALLDVKIGTLKNAIQNFAAGPQADDMKRDVADVVKADAGGAAPAGSGEAAPSGGGGDSAPKGEAAPGAGDGKVGPAKDPKEKIAKIVADVAKDLGWTEEVEEGGEKKQKIKKNIVKSGKAASLQKIITILQNKGKLTEALRRGAIKLQILS